MKKFVEIHVLKNYGAGNLNRDISGSPKCVSFGGVVRNRISSQCLNRRVRFSDFFSDTLPCSDCHENRKDISLCLCRSGCRSCRGVHHWFRGILCFLFADRRIYCHCACDCLHSCCHHQERAYQAEEGNLSPLQRIMLISPENRV